MGERLIDTGEVLLRQIHPNFIHNGEPSSQPFAPTPKDDNKLSVDRSALTDAAASYSLYQANGHASEAVYGVSVGEFQDETLECFADPLPKLKDQAANPAHAFSDYAPYTSNQQKNIAKRLKRKALARGRLHPP